MSGPASTGPRLDRMRPCVNGVTHPGGDVPHHPDGWCRECGPEAAAAAPEPVLDEHGYPTQGYLAWLATFHGTPHQFIDAVQAAWNYPRAVHVEQVTGTLRRPVHRVTLVTMGWSGNEDLQATLERTMFHLMWWTKSERGGLTQYEVPDTVWDTPLDLTRTTPPDPREALAELLDAHAHDLPAPFLTQARALVAGAPS